MVELEQKIHNSQQKYAESVQSLRSGTGKPVLEAARFVLEHEKRNASIISNPLLYGKQSRLYRREAREGNRKELLKKYESYAFQISNLPYAKGCFWVVNSYGRKSGFSETVGNVHATGIEKILFVINYEQNNRAPLNPSASRPIKAPPLEPLFGKWGGKGAIRGTVLTDSVMD